MSEIWSCSGDIEGYKDTQEHLLLREGYKNLREGKALDTDDGQVRYFKEILNARLDVR